MSDYKAWFEKYRPRVLDDIVFPSKEIKSVMQTYYDNGFIKGNILSYGPGGYGKTSLSEVMIHKIIKNPNDIFILGRKTEDVDNLKRWLQQRPVASNQKIVKIEEFDRLSSQAMTVLKDGPLEKFQHNTSFIATTNAPEKIDPALLTRFNIKINFKDLPKEGLYQKIKFILDTEGIQYTEEALSDFIENYGNRGLRDLINNAELASITGVFNPETLQSFVGVSGNEDLIVQYIVYLLKYLEPQKPDFIANILKDARNDPHFFTYYEYMLKIFKNELKLNYHYIYNALFYDSDLDLSQKNIIEKYWQDLDFKRFKSTHTIAMLHDLIKNILEQKGH